MEKLGMSLSVEDSNELERCELVIKQGLQTFIEVGQALLLINEKKLYRVDFATFEDYCLNKWGWKSRQARLLMSSAKVIENLNVIHGSHLPENERQARSLSYLEPEVQREAWAEVIEKHGEDITASKVADTVDKWKPINKEFSRLKEENELNIFNPNPDSNSDLLTRAKDSYIKPHISHNSGDNEWYTPIEFIEAARQVMGCIELDPASSADANEIVKAGSFFTAEINGLDQDWIGNVWMNPPYAQPLMSLFSEKLTEQYKLRNVNQAIVLVNNATETKWFQGLADSASAICFPKGRIRFWKPNSENGAPLQGQAFLYLGENPSTFISVFSSFGLTLFK